MNIYQSGLERYSDGMTIIWSDDYLASNSGLHVRTYRCTFCKRGFSNAQALGGHMNIHRKDRAKLREFSDENLLFSLGITKNTDYGDANDQVSSSATDKYLSPEIMIKEGNSNGKDDENSTSLPLFTEAPSVGGGGEEAAGGGGLESMSKMEMIHDGIDLELRLGPEPHDAKDKTIA